MIATSLLVAMLLAAPSGMISAEPAAALQKGDMSPADRAETSRRFLTAATLHRGDLIAALEAEGEGLDPALLEVVLETVYPIYMRTVGEATNEAIDRLYPTDANGEVTMPKLDAGDLVAIARRLTERFRGATDALAAEAAESAATRDRAAETIAADLLRRLASRDLQVQMRGFHDDDAPGYDTWLDFASARRDLADVATAAARADRDPQARAALDAALAAYRAEGLALGAAIVERSGATAVATRVFWGGTDQQPAELGRVLEASRSLGPRWLEANERLGVAIERFLAAGVGPEGADRHAAARWRLRHLAGTASQSTPVYSAAEMTIDAAIALGACDEEREAMQALLDASLTDLAARRAATVAAHRAWLAGMTGRDPRASSQPSPELVAAYERQSAAEEALRKRILGVLRSPEVVSALRDIREADHSHGVPAWLRSLRQAAPAASENDAPASDEEPP